MEEELRQLHREILKNGGLLCQRREMRYEFISMQKKASAVRTTCKRLQVSPSGYYTYVERGGRRRPDDEIILMTRVREIHRQTDGVYGSRWTAERLQGMGYRVGRYRGPQPDAESEVIGQTQPKVLG